MLSRLWHRFVISVGPTAWPGIRGMRSLLAWVASISPDIHLVNRPGKLQGNNATKKILETRIQPLDIIIKRGTLTLSDLLIPGYFTHAALHLGPELGQEVLKVAGAAGKPTPHVPCILEATRAGVNLTQFDEFLNADSVLILRPQRVTPEEKQRVKSLAASELGKQYDYTFDLEDTRRQFCCKLVSTLFPDLPVADMFCVGAALVPDDFVLPALSGHPAALHPALLIYDGEPIPTDQLSDVLTQLLSDGRVYSHKSIWSSFRRRFVPG